MDLQSASKSQIKVLQKLKLKKYRQKYGSFAVEGRKVVSEILRHKHLIIKSLYATEAWWRTNEAPTVSTADCFILTDKELKAVSAFSTPDLVMAVCEIPEVELPIDLTGWLLFLDGIADPGNLGTIIRTADWFGISHVVASPGSVDYLNSKCIHAAMGSIGRIQIHYHSFKEIKAKYSHVPLLLAHSTGVNPGSLQLNSGILVIGNESHGLSEEILCEAHTLIGIAKHPQSKVESLNAAIATAAVLALLPHDHYR